MNRLECVGETFRHALNTLAIAAPDWLRPHLAPAWAERYGPRFDEYCLPKGDDARYTYKRSSSYIGYKVHLSATLSATTGE